MESTTLSVALLRQRLVSLLQAMPAAQAGEAGSVHQARVASRRLREALPVLGVRADPEALDRARRRVRRITRALGPVRELDVSLGLLAEFAGRGQVSARAIGRVRQAVAAERQARRRDMLAEITPGRLETLRHRLVDVAAPGVPREQPPDGAAAAWRQTGERAAALRLAMDRAGGLYLADRLHRVRIAAKKLRYAVEIQRDLTRSRVSARLAQLKRLQDLLGRVHDLEVLIDRARSVQAQVAASNRRLLAELDTLVRFVEREGRAGHAAYLRQRPALERLCDRVIAESKAGRPTAVA